MKHIAFIILALLLIIASSTAGVQTQAAQETAAATASATPAPASWGLSTLLRLKAGIPFAWLRSTPASAGATVDTALPSDFLVVAGGSAFDGVQWWTAVRRTNGSATGFVEQKSLELAVSPPTSTSAPATQAATSAATATTPAGPSNSAGWAVGTSLVVKSSVPFVWIRPNPLSSAGVLATVRAGGAITVRNATAIWDGVQWWWLIYAPIVNVQGWVEEKSLQLGTAPTATRTGSPAATASPCPSGAVAEGWKALNVVRIRSCVSFVWLRNAPSSAAPVIDTFFPGGFLLIFGEPRSDGSQTWWPVQRPLSATTGWIEQSSLELVGGLTGVSSQSATEAPTTAPAATAAATAAAG